MAHRLKSGIPCTLEAVASFANLKDAARKARRGKSRRPDVEAFFLREETHLLALREELLGGTYVPAPYRLFEIREPKRRVIAAALRALERNGAIGATVSRYLWRRLGSFLGSCY